MSTPSESVTSAHSSSSVPVLVDFLNSVPQPLTHVLVALAPSIAAIRYGVQILSWQSSWYDSWLALAAWWSLCLLSVPVLRYLLPIAILFSLALSKYMSPRNYVPPPVTEHTLQSTITDMTIIQNLLPTIPSPPSDLPAITSLLRTTAILYFPYLVLTHVIALPTLLGLIGTMVLTAQAPWTRFIARTIWSSAHIRWAAYKTYAFLSGIPLSPPTSSLQRTASSTSQSSSIRFLFTLYENQRWWMGLDWTAALLPAERPSWCSAAQVPVSPPNAFMLPSDSSVVMQDGKGGHVRRTARWHWEDAEWKVIVRRDVGSGASPVEKALPKEAVDSDGGDAGGSVSRIRKRLKEGKRSLSLDLGVDNECEPKENESSYEATSDNPFTDPDGWVYGDNKWEGQSSKGGMGKYTRFRRWIRIAVLYEVTEPLSFGFPSSPSVPASQLIESDTDRTTSPKSPTAASILGMEGKSGKGDMKDGLRQRLKTAVKAKS